MVRNIRERIGSLLPATVTSSELVADTWEPWSIILPGIWWTGDI